MGRSVIRIPDRFLAARRAAQLAEDRNAEPRTTTWACVPALAADNLGSRTWAHAADQTAARLRGDRGNNTSFRFGNVPFERRLTSFMRIAGRRN
jgi:hypothetical protein